MTLIVKRSTKSNLTTRLSALEARVQPQAERDRLVQSQQYTYARLLEALDCTSADLPYAQYLPVWWETPHVTFWLHQAAPEEALRWLAQQDCPVVLPLLERFLQRPRFVDPFWSLQHGILPYRATAYEHFIATLVTACHTVWPGIAAAWPTLGNAAQNWLLQCWLLVSDPAPCPWDETTSDEAKLADLAAALMRLYEEYKERVLRARWHPGMRYAYKEHPAYGGQPSGWGGEGQPLGMGKSPPPLDDTAAAFQRHCARQLTARWVTEAAEGAAMIDQAALLAQAQGVPDAPPPHSPGRRAATKRSRGTPGQRTRRPQCSEGPIHG